MAKKSTPVSQDSVKDLLTKYNKPLDKQSLTAEGDLMEQRIAGQRRLFSNNLEEFKKTMWGDGITRTLDGFSDLIMLSVEYPLDITKRPAYIALRDAFYRVMGSMIIVPTEDLGHAFALERGVEDMLREYVYNLHNSGKLACRIRFVRAKNMPVTTTPLYEEITIKFGAKHQLRLCSLHYRY